MPLPFQRKPTAEDFDEKFDTEDARGKLLEKQRENAEREALIKEAKRRGGNGILEKLGLTGKEPLAQLREFLKGAKKGMEKSGTPTKSSSHFLNPTTTQLGTRPTGNPHVTVSVLPSSNTPRA